MAKRALMYSCFLARDTLLTWAHVFIIVDIFVKSEKKLQIEPKIMLESRQIKKLVCHSA